MKIGVSNLGTIGKSELDLRPLTVIIGPNNSSKTYLAYAIYGLWRELGTVDTELLEQLRSVRLVNDGRALDWTFKRMQQALEVHVEAASRRFAAHMASYFQDTSGRLFTRAELALDMGDLRSSLARLHGDATARSRFELELVHERAFMAQEGPRRATETRRMPLHVLEAVIGAPLTGLLRRLFPAPFVLPAERNALVITYKLLANRRLRALRDAARAVGAAVVRDELRYPLPVEDFLDFLADMDVVPVRDHGSSRAEFVALASVVEAKIQGGSRLERVANSVGGTELRVGLGDGLSIDLHNASSAIKQLSALILYLRHKAGPNQLLVIDEPEMNLHPDSQVRLLEVLAVLVRLGVHVLVTTHSPYVMAHLANLVREPLSPRRQRQLAKQLFLGDPRALLAPAEVSAYEMRDGALWSLQDPEHGLRWDGLSDVFGDLQQRYFALDGIAHGKAKG